MTSGAIAMPLTISCPACGVVKKVPDQFAGQKVRCPRCREAFLVEGSSEAVTAGPPAEEVLPIDYDEWAPRPTTWTEPAAPKRWKPDRYFAVGVGGVLMLIVAAGYLATDALKGKVEPTQTEAKHKTQPPPKRVESRPPAEQPKPGVRPTPRRPIARLTAEQLLSAYEANEIAADLRYKGQVIEVTGIVDGIGKDILDNPYVTLRGDNESRFRTVQVSFDEAAIQKLAGVTKGQPVRVWGECKGLLVNVLLDAVPVLD